MSGSSVMATPATAMTRTTAGKPADVAAVCSGFGLGGEDLRAPGHLATPPHARLMT
jgi:hypothetical protein